MKFNLFLRSHFGQASLKVIIVLSLFIAALVLLGNQGAPRVEYLSGNPLSPQKGQFLFRFSRLMNEKSVEQGFSIVPNLTGKVSWSGRTFAYTPDKAINYNSQYVIAFNQAFDRDGKFIDQRIALQQFQSFQLINPNEITTEHGLDVVHFNFVGGGILKNKIVINQVKNPVLVGVFEQ